MTIKPKAKSDCPHCGNRECVINYVEKREHPVKETKDGYTVNIKHAKITRRPLSKGRCEICHREVL